MACYLAAVFPSVMLESPTPTRRQGDIRLPSQAASDRDLRSVYRPVRCNSALLTFPPKPNTGSYATFLFLPCGVIRRRCSATGYLPAKRRYRMLLNQAPVTSPARGWLPLVLPIQPTGFLPIHSWMLRRRDSNPRPSTRSPVELRHRNHPGPVSPEPDHRSRRPASRCRQQVGGWPAILGDPHLAICFFPSAQIGIAVPPDFSAPTPLFVSPASRYGYRIL